MENTQVSHTQVSNTDTTSIKRNIFIVDDDSFLRDMYALRFNQAGYEVQVALNATEALQKIREGLTTDVCLFDVVMPSLDGFELLETLNKENLIPNVKKIFLSNLGQAEDIKRGRELGASSYIVKANNTPSEVVTHVNKVLDGTIDTYGK